MGLELEIVKLLGINPLAYALWRADFDTFETVLYGFFCLSIAYAPGAYTYAICKAGGFSKFGELWKNNAKIEDDNETTNVKGGFSTVAALATISIFVLPKFLIAYALGIMAASGIAGNAIWQAKNSSADKNQKNEPAEPAAEQRENTNNAAEDKQSTNAGDGEKMS